MRRVAIFIFPEVEVLDFAGPFEVFGIARSLADERLFNVCTVAETSAPLRARNGLQIVPDHSFATLPASDILIIPGGFGTRPLLNRPEIIDWIRTTADRVELVASVCTGSLLLARAGLLAGLQATTHYQCFNLLRELEPTALVHEDRRFLDHGRITTSAGISAGIDMSLHLVARLHSAELAWKTAGYMEYHWVNDGGIQR